MRAHFIRMFFVGPQKALAEFCLTSKAWLISLLLGDPKFCTEHKQPNFSIMQGRLEWVNSCIVLMKSCRWSTTRLKAPRLYGPLKQEEEEEWKFSITFITIQVFKAGIYRPLLSGVSYFHGSFNTCSSALKRVWQRKLRAWRKIPHT